MEYTLVLIKPDAYDMMVVGKIISKLEDQNFDILAISGGKFSRKHFEALYQEHKGKSFYEGNLEFMISNMVVALWLRAEDVIRRVRDMIGATDPAQAAHGTIRNMFGTDLPRNCIHASDSPESASRELGIFFPDIEL